MCMSCECSTHRLCWVSIMMSTPVCESHPFHTTLKASIPSPVVPDPNSRGGAVANRVGLFVVLALRYVP